MTEALKRAFHTELGNQSGSRRYRQVVELAEAAELPVVRKKLREKNIRYVTDEALIAMASFDMEQWMRTFGLYVNRLSDPTTRASEPAFLDIRQKIKEYAERTSINRKSADSNW